MFCSSLPTLSSLLCLPLLLLPGASDARLLAAGVDLATPAPERLELGVGSPGSADSPLGTNLAPLSHFSTEIAFKDLFEQSSRWYPQEVIGYVWDTGLPLDIDAEGWIHSLAPGQAAGVLLARDLQGHYPAGEYTLRYQGTGQLEVHLDGVVTQSQPGELKVQVTPTNGGIHLKLIATDAADPLREIQFLLPGFENDPLVEPFNPAYVALLRPFSTVRFMGWQHTNDQTLSEWNERVTPAHSRQTGDGGVALEYMIDLCNQADVDPWFCIPHLASDDFVTQFATLVKSRLEPELQPHIEYSNEVWNAIYAQGWYAQQQGVALGLSTNAYQAQLRFYSQRAVEVFELWNAVYGASRDRLVPVLAGQSVNQWGASQILGWNAAYKHAKVYAVNTYFGRNLGLTATMNEVQNWSLDQLFDALYAYVDQVTLDTLANKRLAQRAGLELYAYEAGQHLVGVDAAVYNDVLTALFISANRDPRMGALYYHALSRWRNAGGTLWLHWNLAEKYSRWGSWGSLEFMDDDPESSPKYSALTRFARNNPRWW